MSAHPGLARGGLTYRGPVLLALGALRVDLTARGVVVGRVTSTGAPAGHTARALEPLVGEGADLVEVAAASVVPRLVADLGVPVAIAAPDPDEAVAGLDAGAAVVVVPGRPALDVLRAARAAGAAVVTPASAAAAAVSAGLPPSQVVVDVGCDLAGVGAVARRLPGHPLGWSRAAGPAAGPVALAMARGCRVFRVLDVRGARRAADVVGSILRAGGAGHGGGGRVG